MVPHQFRMYFYSTFFSPISPKKPAIILKFLAQNHTAPPPPNSAIVTSSVLPQIILKNLIF